MVYNIIYDNCNTYIDESSVQLLEVLQLVSGIVYETTAHLSVLTKIILIFRTSEYAVSIWTVISSMI